MQRKYFYIEPAALHLDKDEYVSEKSMLQFLDAFQEMLYVLGSSQCKVIIDNIIGRSLVDKSGELLIPAKLNEIHDEKLRARINRVQQEFSSIVNPLISIIETDACSIVNDNVHIYPNENEKLFQKEYYLDFFHSILGECYRKSVSSQDILVMPSSSHIRDTLLSIKCDCGVKQFKKEMNCVSYNTLINKKDKALTELKRLLETVKPVSQSEIKVVQAAHEAVIANTVIHRYNEIPSYLRRVWDIFLLLGMCQLDIREWQSPKAKQGLKGSLQKCILFKSGINKEHDIIEGWWRGEDRPYKVYMYFPCGVGKCLLIILGETFNFSDVVTVKENICKRSIK